MPVFAQAFFRKACDQAVFLKKSALQPFYKEALLKSFCRRKLVGRFMEFGSETSHISGIHIVCPCIVFENKQGKDVRGFVESIDKHKGTDMYSPFSLKFGFKRDAHLWSVSQKAEAVFYVIVTLPVKSVQVFKVSADRGVKGYSVCHSSTFSKSSLNSKAGRLWSKLSFSAFRILEAKDG